MSKVVVNKIDSYKGHNDAVYTLEGFSSDNIFFSAAGDGMVVQWDLSEPDKGKLVAKLPNSIYGLHYLRNANVLAIGHNYEGVHFIDLDGKEERASLKFLESAIFDIQSYKNKMYVGGGDGILYILSLTPLKLIDKISVAEKSVRTISINKERQEIAVGTSDNTIKIFDLENHEEKYSIDAAHDNSVFTLKYSPDNKLLLSAGRDAHLKIWDVEAGYMLLEDIVAHMYAINNIAFSPDGKHFVTCSMDKSIKVWDAERFKLLKVIDKARHAGHGTSVNKLLWTNHNDLLVSASDDRTISIWNLEL
ncbi:WD40 repeat domain-containing protein [Fulvivirga lutea]|uniref:WD40 repeat domain-containing protein n=1 Tax=Fulvivirga lutea TaxID=2810512 RepID=A0A974WFX6_9BACT|nr:WD40 repeat domain-containing protein [Fulvivirga lutea]QSE97738.1 WD40 repeat domain-containing protein [Fulvivirga lutea]